MKFLKKLKSGNFWISLISAGVLIAEGIFDVELKTEYLNQILLGLMGVMTLFGIVSDHGATDTIIETKNEVKNSLQGFEEISASNIRSICDTVNLLLNKVSINSSNKESVDAIHNELEEVLKNFLNLKEKNNTNQDQEKIEELKFCEQEKIEENNIEKQIKTEQEKIEENDIEKQIKTEQEIFEQNDNLQEEIVEETICKENEKSKADEIKLIN